MVSLSNKDLIELKRDYLFKARKARSNNEKESIKKILNIIREELKARELVSV